MTFLQPILLWALPLILLPVVIHFLNRLRHRPQPWGAMQFLLAATRNSASNTRLRQFLILLFRVLCVLMLVLFLARPLAGGWLGWALAPAPDAIVILLDRSASMEMQIGGASKRELALRQFAGAAAPFERSSRLILIDSATLQPRELTRAASLTDSPLTRATDTAADIPAMLAAAFHWLVDNRSGSAELWIASDGQRGNWLPEDPRWKSLAAQLGSLSQKVRVRVLALSQPAGANQSILLKEILRQRQGEKSELQFVLDIQRNRNSDVPIPLTVNLDGERSQTEATLEGQSLRWRHRIELGTRSQGGWGSFELPADANLRDNTTYFAYGADQPLRALVVASDADSARCLSLACASRMEPATVVTPDQLESAPALPNAAQLSMVVWQAPLPSGLMAERLTTLVREGAVVVFFPPSRHDTNRFLGLGWADVQDAEPDKTFRIPRWDEDQGPLARSAQRISLPLARTVFIRRQPVAGAGSVLAAFEDGSPFLTRLSEGRGEVYFSASLPHEQWSGLGDGPVLVPMLQRMLTAGGRRLQQITAISCGTLAAADAGRPWVCVDAPAGGKDIQTQAGVYRLGERWMVVNRPGVEDEPEIIDMDEAQRLFTGLPFQSFQEKGTEASPLQGEIWRFFLVAMLLFLIAEALLILPSRKGGAR
jgi:hypothetical protein